MTDVSKVQCPKCHGEGETGGYHYVTHDMAMDAESPEMEGTPIPDFTRCNECSGSGEVPNGY